jgi:hypothetical protein
MFGKRKRKKVEKTHSTILSQKRARSDATTQEEKRRKTETEQEKKGVDNLQSIPQELRLEIFRNLCWKDIISLCATSKFIRSSVGDVAKLLFRERGFGPVFCDSHHYMTKVDMVEAFKTIYLSVIPFHCWRLKVRRTRARNIVLPPSLDCFIFESSQKMDSINLNNASHIFIKHTELEEVTRTTYLKAGNVKTATFINHEFVRSPFTAFKSLEKCVFIDCTLKNVMIKMPLEHILFFNCKFIDTCEFSNAKRTLFLACDFYAGAEKVNSFASQLFATKLFCPRATERNAVLKVFYSENSYSLHNFDLRGDDDSVTGYVVDPYKLRMSIDRFTQGMKNDFLLYNDEKNTLAIWTPRKCIELTI